MKISLHQYHWLNQRKKERERERVYAIEILFFNKLDIKEEREIEKLTQIQSLKK